jgi:hypothetical protein
MPGSPTATLQGWVLPLGGAAPYGEHTYVTSDCGFVWRCWGRSTGGSPLAAATGNSIVADCLSQPNSQAGIRYGFTGVCHQTANRILHPAGITVRGTQAISCQLWLMDDTGTGFGRPWRLAIQLVRSLLRGRPRRRHSPQAGTSYQPLASTIRQPRRPLLRRRVPTWLSF